MQAASTPLPLHWIERAGAHSLTAILAPDVAGYSRLMGADEEGTHERLKLHPPSTHRSEDRSIERPGREEHGTACWWSFRAHGCGYPPQNTLFPLAEIPVYPFYGCGRTAGHKSPRRWTRSAPGYPPQRESGEPRRKPPNPPPFYTAKKTCVYGRALASAGP